MKRTIEIETADGNGIFSFEIEGDFKIVGLQDCSIADETDDYINGNDMLIRVQADEYI